MSDNFGVPEAALLIINSNMTYGSEGDVNAHYSVQGETDSGSRVKGGHVPEDASKQTVSS